MWDEEQQEWRRRFGYKRSGDVNDIPIVEADANAKACLFTQTIGHTISSRFLCPVALHEKVQGCNVNSDFWLFRD